MIYPKNYCENICSMCNNQTICRAVEVREYIVKQISELKSTALPIIQGDSGGIAEDIFEIVLVCKHFSPKPQTINNVAYRESNVRTAK